MDTESHPAIPFEGERFRQLYQVAKVIHSTLDPQEALQLILREAVRLFDATCGSVVLLNPTNRRLEIHAAHGLPPSARNLQLDPSEGITGWVMRHARPVRVGEVMEDARYVAASEDVRSELAVPLFVGGEVRGVLNMDSDRRDAFDEQDEALLVELAEQAATVIQHTWLHESYRQKAGLLESLLRIGQAVNSTLSLDDTLNVITREAARLMNARVCSLMLLNESGDELVMRSCHGGGEAYRDRPPVRVDESLIGTVVRRRKPLQETDVRKSGRYQQGLMAQDEGLVSLVSLPLAFGERAIGVLNVYTERPHIFSDEELRILTALADSSAVAIEKARLYERIVDVEEQLRRSEQLSVIGLIAAEVAHEIRNPLTVMKMLYHSLDLEFVPGDPREEDVKIMGQKMEHLNRVVDQILDFARRAAPELAPVDVNRLIDDLGLLTRHKLKAAGVRVERLLDPDLPTIEGDATQLEQAFLNLTLNAVEAMAGGGRLRITTLSVRDGIEVRFQDTGPGMDEARQKAVFSSWFTSGKEKGTGLGLAIVARVVDAHGGQIGIDSRVGEGTSFRLHLPFSPPRVPNG
jgi:signal transduction histidine kinase